MHNRHPTETATNSGTSLGFTLIEMVVTLVIIGVIGAVTISRFAGSDSFTAYILRDQIISLSRNAQQSSLGRPDVTLLVRPSLDGETVKITTATSGSPILSISLDIDAVTISGDVNETESCATEPASPSLTTITNAAPFTLNYGELGDLEPSGFGAGTAVTSGVRICLNRRAEDSVCISPSGFAYAGDCDV